MGTETLILYPKTKLITVIKIIKTPHGDGNHRQSLAILSNFLLKSLKPRMGTET